MPGRIYGEVVDPKTGELIRRLDERGREVPYGDPIAVPMGVARVDDTLSAVRRLVHSEFLRSRADAEGFDSPEEADDFDLEDDPLDPLTPYEEHFMPPRPTEEVSDGSTAVVKGGVVDDRSGAGISGEVGKDKSKSEPATSDSGGVPKAGGNDPKSEK